MNKPLAYRLRPTTLDEVVGQTHLIGENKIISNMIHNKKIFSMILYGVPGIGKTTLATVIANELKMRYRVLNAVINNKKDFDIVIEEAKLHGHMIVIIDEIHRMNKDKQDLLLPHLETGLISLIGLTTSNPYFSINPAIRSRCQIFELNPLNKEDLVKALKNALSDTKSGLGNDNIIIDENTLEYIAEISNGDVRYALNLLEVSLFSNNDSNITLEHVRELAQKANIYYDKDDDGHYDLLSAFQKSIRGSDINATMHYLGRLIEVGDLESIYRRMLIIAYEDIGLANPDAPLRTLAAIESCERVGLPEGRIPLSVAAAELALSPKSNTAYSALDEALADIRSGRVGSIPSHLRDAHYKGAKDLNHGVDYLYPHNYESGWVKQQYLPDSLKSKEYYKPKQTSKFERALKERYDAIKKATKI